MGGLAFAEFCSPMCMCVRSRVRSVRVARMYKPMHPRTCSHAHAHIRFVALRDCLRASSRPWVRRRRPLSKTSSSRWAPRCSLVRTSARRCRACTTACVVTSCNGSLTRGGEWDLGAYHPSPYLVQPSRCLLFSARAVTLVTCRHVRWMS